VIEAQDRWPAKHRRRCTQTNAPSLQPYAFVRFAMDRAKDGPQAAGLADSLPGTAQRVLYDRCAPAGLSSFTAPGGAG
jgi:hypothetical protein